MGRYRKPFTLFKRGKYWYYKTYTPDGYRTSGNTTGQTQKKLAEEYCMELLKVNRLGLSVLTLGDYAAHFFDDGSPFVSDRAAPMSASTLRLHRQYLRIHILPKFAKRKLSDISFSELKAWRQSLVAAGYKPNTINGIFSTFAQIMKWAFLDGKIARNPLAGFGTLAREKTRDAFRRSEAVYVCRHAPSEVRDFVALLALTGMRFSECYGLTESDIREENGVKYIDLRRQMIGGEYVALKTKDARQIPIADECARLVHSQTKNENFIKNHMRPVIRSVDGWLERGLCLHALRHFFVTDTKARGINPVFVESVAGHSLRGIEAVYTNFHAPDLRSIREWQSELYAEVCGKTPPKSAF